MHCIMFKNNKWRFLVISQPRCTEEAAIHLEVLWHLRANQTFGLNKMKEKKTLVLSVAFKPQTAVKWILMNRTIGTEKLSWEAQFLHWGGTLVMWLALLPHSKKVLGRSGSGHFCVEIACSPCVCVGLLWILRLPPISQKHANWGLG